MTMRASEDDVSLVVFDFFGTIVDEVPIPGPDLFTDALCSAIPLSKGDAQRIVAGAYEVIAASLFDRSAQQPETTAVIEASCRTQGVTVSQLQIDDVLWRSWAPPW